MFNSTSLQRRLPIRRIGKCKVVGLTGGLAMGKSAVTRCLQKKAVPVFDADIEVHKLYARSQPIQDQIRVICPDAVTANGIDRGALSQHLSRHPDELRYVEKVIRSELNIGFRKFIKLNTAHRRKIIAIDAPLLFEGGFWRYCDQIWVVSAHAHQQLRRARGRPNLSSETVALLLRRQLRDERRRALADQIIPASLGMGYMRRYVAKLVAKSISDVPDHNCQTGQLRNSLRKFPARWPFKQGRVPR